MGNIQIDLKKLINNKDEIITNRIINQDSEKIIEQLKQHINSGSNSCFLVSGYRGTGKTTIIENLEKKMSDDNILFVKLNISKYEEHCYIMRKLIRGVYHIYTDKSRGSYFIGINKIKKVFCKKSRNLYKNEKNIKIKESNFRKRIELLYDRTFNEITYSNMKKNNLNISINISKESNIKSLITFIIAILTMLFSIKFNFRYMWIQNILELLSKLWIVILTFKIIIKFSKEISISNEISRKSLYDNEIAELQLIDILKDLNDLEYKVVIVLDELDKIENEEKINKILSEFKPLLISNLATFIVISGQKLYYQLSNSSIIDDSLISNLFSKTIHTPLASYDTLNELFNNCIVDSQIDDSIKKKYIDSVILRSNTTIRLFINIISQDIIWHNNKSYIKIKDEDIGKLETDSKILKAVHKVIKENIDPFDDLDKAIKDFLICQLYLWAKKMKLIGKEKFNTTDIFNFERDYSKIYPRWCEIQLTGLLNNLLEKLVKNEKIMEKEEMENDEEIIVLYKWIEGIDINEESNMEKIAKMKINFIDEFIIIEKYCREIYMMISKKNYKDHFSIIISNLFNWQIIDENSYKELKLYSKLRNMVVHGEYVEDIKKYNLNIMHMTTMLVEKYSYYICKSYLETLGYELEINYDYDKGYDFIARSQEGNKEDILIIVKYRRHLSKINKKQLVNNLLLTNKKNDYKKTFKIVALVYTEEHINNQSNYIDRSFIDDNVNILYISNILKLNIGSYFKKIIDNQNDFIAGSPCQMSGQECPACIEGIMDVSESGDGVTCSNCNLYIPA